MAENNHSIEVETTGPDYLGWRGELLARLALARVPGLTAVKVEGDEPGWDFLAATPQGLCFFIEVEAFSSLQRHLNGVEAAEELRWHVDAEHVRRARASRSPVVLFLFDADTDHGRFLRLDTLAAPAAGAKTQTVRLPRANIITREGIEKLVAELQKAPRR
jgi:hypothetical protein